MKSKKSSKTQESETGEIEDENEVESGAENFGAEISSPFCNTNIILVSQYFPNLHQVIINENIFSCESVYPLPFII